MFGERNFNVGDLVISKMPVELTFDDHIIKPGAVGLVISLMQYQDWFMPWTSCGWCYHDDFEKEGKAALHWFCNRFYFGEG